MYRYICGHIFESNEIEMGRSVVLLALFALLFTSEKVGAQIPYVLGIDSIAGLPDTLIDGEEYTFYVEMTNSSPLAFQGDSGSVKLMLEYNGSDVVEADSTILQSALVAPAGNSLLEVHHRFSSGGGSTLSIGINVVVVWPRINDGIYPPQEIDEPDTMGIVLIEPNSIRDHRNLEGFKVYPNPTTGLFDIAVNGQRPIQSVQLIDLSGRVQLSWGSGIQSSFEVNSRYKGNYVLKVLFEDGTQGHQLIILR